jgi:DNA-binding XRE family transcriptional regulator
MIAMGAVAAGGAMAQPAHDIPQSIRLQHEEDEATLNELSRKPAPVGPAAKAALDLVKRHHQREAEYILPPLTLLPQLADGKVTPDMKWAIEMADKVKANHEQIFQEHAQITDAMNALLLAADRAHNAAAAEFARGAVADSLADMELDEPTTILIGDYLRSKLPATP